MPSGDWETEGKRGLKSLAADPSSAIPFHILVQGTCWMRIEGQEFALAEGDVVAFPFGTRHKLGAGGGGRMIAPVEDLPPKPWREVPVLRYGGEGAGVRLLCG